MTTRKSQLMFQRAYCWPRRLTSAPLHVNSVCWLRSSSTSLAVFLLAELRSLPGWRAWNFC